MSPFMIGKRVKIKSVGMQGTIDAMYVDALGTQWRVQYTDATGTIHDIYRPESDLEAI